MANKWLLCVALSAIVAAWHSGVSPIHNGQVCSTWGNFHFKTFDGDVFQLHSTCNYVLTSLCKGMYSDFNIQIRRDEADGHPTIKTIIMKLEGSVVELSKGSVVVDGKLAILPVSQSGVFIEKTPTYIKIKAKLGLLAIWNEEDSFLVELDLKYKNQTCGLCGDFNGVQLYNEFYSHGVTLSTMDFANFWKMDGPVESCSDYTPESTQSCNDMKPLCEQILTGPAFNTCHNLLDIASFTSACVADLCHCGNGKNEHADPSCLCNTVSEFSRQCVHAGGKPHNWRTKDLCLLWSEGTLVKRGQALQGLEPEYNSIVCRNECYQRGYGSHVLTKWSTKSVGVPVLTPAPTQRPATPVTVTASMDASAPQVITIHPNGKVFVNGIYAQLPFSAAGLTAFRGSSFYLLVQTSVGVLLEVQLQPIMQLYITVNTDYKTKTCGLCGNFNNNQADDFLKLSGVPDATAAGFVNSWKTHASCPNVKTNFENPCSLSLDNERYAKHWCSMLSDPKGVFAPCHLEISPDSYRENCMYDSCNCEKSEDCMCAAVSSYVHACAAAGIQVSDWRKNICGKYASSCPSSMVYSYNITSSSRTCRCIDSTELSCHLSFLPIDGCICAEGTYLDESGKCVPPKSCPCYDKGSVVPPGQVVNKDGVMCTCKNGKFSCIGEFIALPSACAPPMVFFNCSAHGPGAKGTECEKSCTLDMACMSTGCVSGCMCPSGMVSDGKGGCINPEACSCVHNGISYQPGETTKVDCNTCTCKDRKWQCTTDPCDGTCSVYGDGHYMTFDQKRFTFDGNCEYILTQDYCGSAQSNGTFRVITENVPCGTTGTTCSKTIKIFLGSAELILTEGNYQLLSSGNEETVPFRYSTMGIYLVIEANNGLIFMWDKKTSLFIKLSPKYKGRVCGLCGNYDGNANNDFTTRCHAVVVNSLVFGNSWKDSPSCPDAQGITSPCTANPYRQSWAQKQCSIIQSDVFSACHSTVDPTPYYEACVFDSCACDTGGDCECFCTAVAAYAESCNQAGICIRWRTPKICPIFCDYYNPPGECEWHYMPCGSPCMKTCRNPSGICSTQIPPLEACTCTYNGNKYPPGTTIYNTTDGHGNCITAVCRKNGTINKGSYPCPVSTPTTHMPTSTTNTPSQPTTIFVFTSTTSGSIVYNETDLDGHCFIGYCNENCHVVPQHYPCVTSTPHPTSNTTPTTTSITTHNPGCVDLNPPRKDGESWKVNKCVIGTCVNGKVTYSRTPCPTKKPLVCANNYPAVEVQDDECCSHYECQCICYGWGDPHYVTFDGTYYAFQGNCSYWLVKEILPKYNFSVMIDNYYCGALDGLSCPQSITVFYKSYKIFITQKEINGIFKNQIYVNNKAVSLAYQTTEFSVTTTGIDTVLVIPQIHAKVTFSGLMFSIYLPYSIFGNNTQGQCGTCTNNRTDDCRLPTGKIDPSCPNMAHEWHANGSLCEHPVQPKPTPTPTPCDTSICEIFESRYNNKFVYAVNEFSAMLKTTLEGCRCPNGTILLSSNSNECVPSCELCQLPNGQYKKPNEKWNEGCKECTCEDHTMQVTCHIRPCPSYPPLSCDQEGQVKVNYTDTTGCCHQERCECDVSQCTGRVPSCPIGYTLNIIHGACCLTYTCAWTYALVATLLGLLLKTCAVQYKRLATNSHLTKLTKFSDSVNAINLPICSLLMHWTAVPHLQAGVAVLTFLPYPSRLETLCLEIHVSSAFVQTRQMPASTSTYQSVRRYHVTHTALCEMIINKEANMIQNSHLNYLCCVDTVVEKLLKSKVNGEPGTIWTPPGKPCVKFECVKIANQFITVEAKTICPSYEAQNCIPGTETTTPDGCCPVCIPKGQPCNVSTSAVYLESKGCQSKEKINVTSCSGACGTYTFYSTKMRSLQHSCSCCQELFTSERQVQLFCPDNTELTYTYTHIDACGCLKTECSAFSHGEMASTPSSSVRSRRRRG
ncbi:Mucin-5B Ovomucin, alpha-subunit [Collichthys lucidus]|uniref:Mucin-5B Ovomucin, alpha-subunit n=1 Tax=Collichthys lucidus TaxID=240159 RepID=A0A4U5U922_COLLU|nr:Mucin-5B Ovomucin, alpha-subunit [Collichthys lucidus]